MQAITVNVVFSIGEVLVLAALCMRKMAFLRIFSTFASCLFMIGALIAGMTVPGMLSTLIWSIIFIVTNVIQLILILIEARPILLPQQLQSYYNHYFKDKFTTREFSYLFKNATVKTALQAEIIINEGKDAHFIALLVGGSATILKNNKNLCEIQPGQFIGEISYLIQKPPTTTVQLHEGSQYVLWEKSDINTIKESKKRNPIYQKLTQMMNQDVVKKLMHTTRLVS
ncbi:MAG: hypothetical protein COB66_06625 [Coxiella sp. (in: Bacteria)]|nr:MAG: hypothetical protein COB66_06625 [Coxiella sp. (in: g-proteobacteria)]